MTLLVAIDPGKRGVGLSIFYGEQLLHAAYVGGLGGAIHPLLETVEPVKECVAPLGEEVDTLVIEVPQVYQTAQQKGDQRDLIDLAVVAGSLAAACAPYTKAALFIRPAQWKGQTTKEVTKRRVEKRLSEDEQGRIEFPRAKSLHHNVYDAIGIGLWRLQR